MRCNFKKEISNNKSQKGFTLVELMVTIGIFVLMTALLLAKYGTFNQSILLKNLAYDVALTIRNAQYYGLNVKSAPTSGSFQYPFGVHFELNSPFVFFSDDNSSLGYNEGNDTVITKTQIKGTSKISGLCTGEGCTGGAGPLDIVFKRPDPNAIINGGNISYAKITLSATDGSTRYVIIRSTGQISVE